MAYIIIVDGPDNSGKTTFIQDICELGNQYQVIDFPKRTDEGRFDIKSRNEVACFETLLEYLDPKKVHILDRGYISNWVYGKLRNEEVNRYEDDFNRLRDNNHILPIILTRNEISVDFKDDLISLDSTKFNKVIKLFNEFAEENDVKVRQMLNHGIKNDLKSTNASERDRLITEIIKWSQKYLNRSK